MNDQTMNKCTRKGVIAWKMDRNKVMGCPMEKESEDTRMKANKKFYKELLKKLRRSNT